MQKQIQIKCKGSLPELIQELMLLNEKLSNENITKIHVTMSPVVVYQEDASKEELDKIREEVLYIAKVRQCSVTSAIKMMQKKYSLNDQECEKIII